MRFTLFSLFAVAALAACSGSDPSSSEPLQSEGEAVSARIHCKTVDDCNAAFESGAWKLSPSSVDTCVQNHDFPYYCMACSAKGVCSFHPGF